MRSRSRNISASLPLALRLEIDEVCDRYEADRRQGIQPSLRIFLDGFEPRDRPALFRELLALDLAYRAEEGEGPNAQEYRDSFPEYIDLINVAFRQRENAAETVDAVSGEAVIELETAPGAPDNVTGLRAALRAAGYEVLEELGRGGMGLVLRAHQASLNRTVAVKVIRSGGFASTTERRRFLNEAESVARLDHPHIVPVYEVGQSHGLHFFSMKLVNGASLDRRLDSYSADPHASAKLVAVVAAAVHHAHQRGILHRDLKPANILIDEQGQPHVTDFGLARHVEPNSELTISGALVGTPSYMSPEQAKGTRGGSTTATDIYGLGSILYALLTGRPPHTGSSVLETLDLVRGTAPEPPSKLNRRVPRDLEIICLKCLEKDPGRRYESAGALTDDLTRWIEGKSITARPAGVLRKIVLWCRRYPLPAALSGTLVLTLFLGLAGVTWKWREAERERKTSARTVDYVANVLLSESSTDFNPRAAKLTVVEMLDRVGSRIAGDFQDQPETEAVIREMVGRSYLSLGEYAKAEPHLRVALRRNAQSRGPEDAASLRVANLLASVLDLAGRPSDAESLLRTSLNSSRRVLGSDAPITLQAMSQLGTVLRKSRKLDEAESLLRATLTARRRVLPVDDPDTLRSVWDLCLLCLDRDRFDEAEALAHEYEHGIRCARGPKHPDNVTALTNRGLIRRLQGKPAEAEPFYRAAVEAAQRILGPAHPITQSTARDHADLLREVKLDDLPRSQRSASPEVPSEPTTQPSAPPSLSIQGAP